MKAGARTPSPAYRVITRRDFADSKTVWIRGLSKQDHRVCSLLPELLQLPTSHADRTVNRRRKASSGKPELLNSLATCTPFLL
jgi:hypothetical protein